MNEKYPIDYFYSPGKGITKKAYDPNDDRKKSKRCTTNVLVKNIVAYTY